MLPFDRRHLFHVVPLSWLLMGARMAVGQSMGSIEATEVVPYQLSWRVWNASASEPAHDLQDRPWLDAEAAQLHLQFQVSQSLPVPDQIAAQWSHWSDDQVALAVLAQAPLRWYSLGLNPQKRTMVRSDFYFAFMLPSGLCRIEDRWWAPRRGKLNVQIAQQQQDEKEGQSVNAAEEWKANRVPQLDTDLGGQDNILDPMSKWTVDREERTVTTVCSFARPLITGDALDYDLRNESILLMYGWGPMEGTEGYQKHKGSLGHKVVNFYLSANSVAETGPLQIDGATPIDRSDSMIFWHAALMLIAWFVLMIPMTYLARYCKVMIPTWFFVHWRLQLLGVVMALVALILVLVELEGLVEPDPHAYLGFVLIALLFVQCFLGYMSNALWYEGKPPHIWPDQLHWWLGRLVLLGGAVNCFLGTAWYGDLFGEQSSTGHMEAMPVLWGLMSALAGWVAVTGLLFEWLFGQQHEYLMVPDADTLDRRHLSAENLAEKQSWTARLHRFLQGPIVRDERTGWTPGKLLIVACWAGASAWTVGLIYALCVAA